MTITHIDNVYQVTGSGLGIVPGIWVRLLNNNTAVNYYSSAATDPTGAFTHTAPPGDYSLYTGSAATVPGTPTLRNAHYSVPVTAGDDVAANSYTASSSPYSPSAASGGGDYAGLVRFGGGPTWDISHPNFGAKGDNRWVVDAAITTGLKVLTSATFAFTQADVGKTVLINGAGTAGDVFSTTIASVTNGTTAVTAAAAVLTVSGANACLGTDNAIPIQLAINSQQTFGGRVKVSRDSYGGKYLVAANVLVPAPGSQAGGFTNATLPLIMDGDGMQASVLVCGQDFVFNGLIGYTGTAVHAQVILNDLCLDGNYAGVGGGVLPQVPPPSAGALFAVVWPWTSVATDAYNGWYHEFNRVRFYRAHAYCIQGCHGVRLVQCEFDQVGQPDLAAGGLHLDNLGSGQGDAIVIGCTWRSSSGNYADFVDGTGGAGHMLRLIFKGNTSYNHQIGGIYAAGLGSIIDGNRLNNLNAGSGVGYDGGTHASMKSKNLVSNNVLDLLNVNASGLSFTTYADRVHNNTSADSAYTSGQGPLTATDGITFGGSGLNGGAGVPGIYSDGANLYVGAVIGSIFLRAYGQTVNSGLDVSNTGMLTMRDAAGTARAQLFSGSGAPSLNATVGALYFRVDVPFDSSQRIYICTVAGNPATFVPVDFPTIQAPALLTGRTAAVASIATLTSPNDGVKHIYQVSGTVTITTLGSGVINLEVTYTDDNGTARTCIIPLCAEAGTFATAANTADAWKGHVTISVNPNTVLTVLTAGTFTGCTYNTSGQIKQIL